MKDLLGERKIVLEPSDNEWESFGVLNPTTIEHEGNVHIFYRAVKNPNYSVIGHGIINDFYHIVRDKQPILVPSYPEELEGIEDPRITKIDDTFYILYTAWDGKSAKIGLAESKDLKHFEKKGIISPNISIKKAVELTDSRFYKYKWNQQLCFQGEASDLWDKDAVLFPEKIKGKYAMIHRFNPCMQIVLFSDLEELKDEKFWEDYVKNIEKYTFGWPEFPWESRKVGAGPTPLKTKEGWLLLYHGRDVRKQYQAGVMLLDLKDPTKIIGRLDEPLFSPIYEWELKGVVDQVVFPQGLILKEDVLYVYYGCADKIIAVIPINFPLLIKKLKGKQKK